MMLIANGVLVPGLLNGKTAIITGAGRGIGFEAARSLIWLGARVIIAEVDKRTGLESERKLKAEFGPNRAYFIHTDVGVYRSIVALKNKCLSLFGKIDAVLNNAAITPMGSIKDRSIGDWDKSYQVNLRGPLALAQLFLPGMLKRQYGVLVFISSVGLAYMGAYETFKAAQVHLAETLDAELDGSGVFSFSIGPGLVYTPGSLAGINELAPMYGKTVDEFYAMSADQIVSAEAAGAGIAAAIAMADRFHGQDTSSKQALSLAGINLSDQVGVTVSSHLTKEQSNDALAYCRKIHEILTEQSTGWLERPLFERQWMQRDFRKNAGMPVELWIAQLNHLQKTLEGSQEESRPATPPLGQLIVYYTHLHKLHDDYEKDPGRKEKQATIILSWRKDVENLKAILG
jgi:NAD(P)-dependent dehydrogenase (short-subunit alcohol dehydrogenase family)